MGALALGLASCDDKSDLGIAQVNPQEPIVEANGLTLAAEDAYDGTIDLDNTVGQNIPILRIEDTSGLPENAVLSFKLAVADNEQMTNAQHLDIERVSIKFSLSSAMPTADDQYMELNGGVISSDDLERIIIDLYDITPEIVTPWMGIEAYITIGTQMSRLGGDDFYYLKKQVNVLPVDERLDIENSYYIGGTISQQMEHSDKHAYIDNKFIAIIDVTAAQAAAGFEWYIVPGSMANNPDLSKCWGPTPVAGSDDLVEGVKGTITSAGTYRIVTDMLAKTYSIGYAYEVLYTPGTGNGWNQEASMKLYTNDYANYFGVTRTGADGTAKGEFKLDASKDWSMNWGLDGGVLTPNGSNIVTEPAGLWFVSANLNSLTLSLVEVKSVGIIGLNGDWNTDIAMTPSSDMLIWTGTMTADGDTEFKFRFNGGWDANLGGTLEKLVANGDNIPVGAGTYQVVLDMTNVPYTCTLTAK